MKIKIQDDIKDCGLYVIQALHNYQFGKWIDIDELRRSSTISQSGMSINSLIQLGRNFGIDIAAYEAPESAIQSETNKYFIAIVSNMGENHYVIAKYNGKKYLISDPAKGEYSLSIKEFSKIYQGYVMFFAQREYLKREYHNENIITYLLNNKSLMIWIIITSLLAIVFSFVSTLFSKIILDYVLPGGLKDVLSITVVTFIFVVLVRGINKLFNSFLHRKLLLVIENDLYTKYFLKLRTASLIEMSKLSKVDHIRRFATIPEVSSFIASAFLMIFDESIVFIFATSILIFIEPAMFGIALAFSLIIVLITLCFKLILKDKHFKIIDSSFRNLQSQIERVEGMYDLKSVHDIQYSDRDFVEKMLDYKTNEQSLGLTLSFQSLFTEIVLGIAPIILLNIGVSKIFANELTIGSVMMFVSIFNSFISPLSSLCEMAISLNENLKNLKLLKYVLDSTGEKIGEHGIKNRKINSIEFKNIDFGFDKNIIKIDNLKINKSIYIEGKNGSGKSTLINLINLKHLTKGEITINGIDLSFFNIESVRSKMFTSSSKTFLPSMSIYEYITLRNADAIKRFESNLIKYNLPQLLKTVNLNLESQIIDNGSNLSSGQRQLVILLRLFAFEYDFILLDEAFENIDSSLFEKISKHITTIQDAIFVEISHSKKYIHAKEGVNIEEINKN